MQKHREYDFTKKYITVTHKTALYTVCYPVKDDLDLDNTTGRIALELGGNVDFDIALIEGADIKEYKTNGRKIPYIYLDKVEFLEKIERMVMEYESSYNNHFKDNQTKTRDYRRIQPFLHLLEAWWSLDNNVDLRFMQMIESLDYRLKKECNSSDSFYIEDDMVYKVLEKMYVEAVDRKLGRATEIEVNKTPTVDPDDIR